MRALFVTAALGVSAAAFFCGPAGRQAREESAAAHRQARWGMSPSEVARVNDCLLEPAEGPQRYFQPKSGVPASDYLALREKEGLFLGREAAVVYLFYRERLFGYHVFVAGLDEWELDRLLTRELEARFGSVYQSVDDEGPLRRVWNLPDVFVNYWRYADPFSVFNRPRAGFGVVYRPIEERIPARP